MKDQSLNSFNGFRKSKADLPLNNKFNKSFNAGEMRLGFTTRNKDVYIVLNLKFNCDH